MSRGKIRKRHLHFAGYDFTSSPEGTTIHRGVVDVSREGDYGCDPLPDGTFRMVPSGDIVDYEERCRRLMHIKDAGYREKAYALWLASVHGGSSADAATATYDPSLDRVEIKDTPDIEHVSSVVAMEATETVTRLLKQGFDEQGLAAAIERISSGCFG